jgi:P-type Mg2+ transporter
LGKAVERVNLFAKLTPGNKARIIRALRSNRHVVGYIGDGINDALALRDADVGISVDSAADIARESADAVLTDKDLTVLERAIIEGRTAFGNTVKFIKTTASSNFGNVFSVVAASTFLPFLPFLPMLPLQFLMQNLLYDFSQTAIPFDDMDTDYAAKPRQWNTAGIGWFMVVFGPLSSIFDFAMFAVLWWIFGANTPAQAGLFQTGWFLHGMVTQTLIVLVLRTQRIPFLQSWPSPALLGSSLAAVACAVALPYLPVGEWLHFVRLPAGCFLWIVFMMASYAVLTQAVKSWYIRRFGEWL